MADDPPLAGATTATSGTPVAVDLTRDRRARSMWFVLLGGPLLWISHFMFVYLVAEAGCTGDGPGLDLFDPPVPRTVTLAVTALAAAGCAPLAAWSLRRWRQARQEPSRESDEADPSEGRNGEGAGPGLPFAGFLLTSFSFLAIVFVGLPAAFLPSC